MEAKTLNCPMCGAAARSDASQCEHCDSRLASVACPSCFDLMFLGQKFCPNCGALARRGDAGTRGKQRCPRCTLNLSSIEVGGTPLLECAQCDGLWLDNITFEEICRAREQQAVFLRHPSLQDPLAGATIEPVKYLKCPGCSTLMNRVNFAGCSGVIVDVCKSHGTWFDRAELRRIIDFIRAGGMDKAREQEMRKLSQERRTLAADRAAAAAAAPYTAPAFPSTIGEIDVLELLAKGAWELLRRL